ncbi:outer membrane lipoprotein-sorting protein [Kineobactrum salinum]|uniref:outer membrane lipoprotein-sorting protein n=1 Tax=Kineobactrum salinum TaxID=2708301 RepID=UPI0018D65E80|nr:outer membrane lipoprotein-sorting protein [Kineobactrum salinum]
MSGGRVAAVFTALVRHPWWALLPATVVLVLALGALPELAKDTRSDAFLAPDNPALLYRDLVRERFGLSDPLLIALVADGPEGIYRPDILQAVADITAAVKTLPNVDANNVVSLATESLITGDEFGIEVQPILDPMPATAAEVAAMRAAVEDFPLLVGSLVAAGGEATLVVAQLVDEADSETTYRDILQLLAGQPLPPGLTTHVAGEGAIAGYLGAYIDADAQRLNPLAGLIILSIIVLAFRRLTPALLAVVMIVAAVGISLGIMAALQIPFFVITNALPVILIGIAVADTIHICSHYFDQQAAAPQRSREELVVATMTEMWLPVTLTSLTTAAGFLGLYFAAEMPPFRYFGLFAALGVAVAWLYTLLVLPPLIMLGRMQVHQSFINRRRQGQVDVAGRLLAGCAWLTRRGALPLVLICALLALAGGWAGSKLQVDDDRIRLFHSDEAIVRADRAINRYFNGSTTLDIVIETAEPEGLFEPRVLRKIEALQDYAGSLPHVTGSSSIVDYLKQMNRVLNNNESAAYALPGSREQVAQYFLLYSFSADPADFQQEIDYDYRSANVRLTMNHGGYQQIKPVVEALERYLASEFQGEVRATLSGRASLNYHWVRNIGESHLAGLLIALVLVWAVSSLSFRSALAGVYTLVPVVVAVLLVYAFMVLRGMTLGVGTSMFAAVAIGLGVDFAIHTISRLRYLYKENGAEEQQMFTQFYATTGRALLLNVLAVASGFGVLIVSQISQLSDFGYIVMLSMGVSFLASVTLLPALVKLLRPAFIYGTGTVRRSLLPLLFKILLVVALAATWLFQSARAAEVEPGTETEPSSTETEPGTEAELCAEEVVTRVNAVPQGEQVTRELLFRTTDKHDRSRERETVSYRRFFGDERRVVLFFTAPANIRDTAVLTWDYADPAREDDQWLYLPALRKVRRIPASERGDYFLGTDFSFEDMKLDGKLSADDYHYSLAEPTEPGSYTLEAVPVSEAIAEELGYSRTLAVVDPAHWIVTRVDFWDLDGEHLKTLHARDIRQVDGIWTRHQLLMENHQTGHRTELEFRAVDYRSEVNERVFTQQALRRGL